MFIPTTHHQQEYKHHIKRSIGRTQVGICERGAFSHATVHQIAQKKNKVFEWFIRILTHNLSKGLVPGPVRIGSRSGQLFVNKQF